MHAALPPEDLDLVLSLTPTFWSRHAGSRLLVTGGTGFIGSWLLQVVQRANDCLDSQIELLVLTRNPDRARQQSPHMFERADTRLVAGNVTTFADPMGALDLCIHAAAEVGNPHQPLQVFDTIVQGTRRMLDLAQSAGARRFLLASSGAVYGPQPTDLERMPESYGGAPDPLHAANAYGNGKRAAEWLACAYAARAAQPAQSVQPAPSTVSAMPSTPSGPSAGASFSPTIARIFAVLGPGLPLDGTFAAGNFIRDALAGRPIQINGDGTPLRSYLYTADLCGWLLRILESGAAGQAYNVGSEHALSIASLAHGVAQTVEQAGGQTVPINWKTPPSATPQGLPSRYVPDTSKARQSLGLAEYTPFDAALRKTIQWTRSRTMAA